MRDRVVIIDISTKKFKALSYKQYDDNNLLQVVITDNKEIVDISEYIADVYFELPSGKIIEMTPSIVNNTINIMLSNNVLSEHGKVTFEIEMSKNGKIVTVFSMYLNVEKSINEEDTPIEPGETRPSIRHSHENLEILDKFTQEMIDLIYKPEVDLSDYITNGDLEEHLKKYVTIDEFNVHNHDNEYVGKIEFNSHKHDEYYITQSELDKHTEDYVTKKDFGEHNHDDKYVDEDFVLNKIDEARLDDGSGTPVDLSRFATRDEVNEKANNLFKADMETVTSLGGISAGTDLNNMSIQDILTRLLYPYVKPTVTASLIYSPTGGVYEYGQTVTVTGIKAVVTKKSEEIKGVGFRVDNYTVDTYDKVQDGGEFSKTFSIPQIIKKTVSNSYFQVVVVDGRDSQVFANTIALNFYYPYYYGVINPDVEITEDIIKGLNKQVVAKGNKNYTYNPSYQRMVIAYPKSYGYLKTILDPNGFEQLPSFTITELSIVGLDGTSQMYYVYANEASTNTNFTMKFNY